MIKSPLAVVAPLAATVAAAAGLSPSPNFTGIVVLLATLQLHQKLLPRRVSSLLLWTASSVGAIISYYGAASNVLQSSASSKGVLVVVSAFTSGIGIGAIFIDSRYISKGHRYNWTRLTIFPAFWASVWGILSFVSPFGRLLVWSPVDGIGPYSWVSSWLGPWGIDFVAAAWSVLLAEALTTPLSRYLLLMEDSDALENTEHFPPYADNPNEIPSKDHSTFHHTSALFVSLLALTLPSLWVHTIPNPTYTTATTPFTLGCVLPRTHLPHMPSYSPTLDDYIHDTKKMTDAKLVLWPEGALRFNSENERNAAFDKIANQTLKGHKGLHIGLGFEDNAPQRPNQRASRRNGFALLVDDKVVLQYYKRKLVPCVLIFHSMVMGLELTSTP